MATRTRFVFGTQVYGSLSDSVGGGREWLPTDGTGGCATGAVAGPRTRRGHALLTAPDQAQVALGAVDPVLFLPSAARGTVAHDGRKAEPGELLRARRFRAAGPAHSYGADGPTSAPVSGLCVVPLAAYWSAPTSLAPDRA